MQWRVGTTEENHSSPQWLYMHYSHGPPPILLASPLWVEVPGQEAAEKGFLGSCLHPFHIPRKPCGQTSLSSLHSFLTPLPFFLLQPCSGIWPPYREPNLPWTFPPPAMGDPPCRLSGCCGKTPRAPCMHALRPKPPPPSMGSLAPPHA